MAHAHEKIVALADEHGKEVTAKSTSHVSKMQIQGISKEVLEQLEIKQESLAPAF